MKRIRIIHKTEYHYHTPVTFGPHSALLRPREGHDVHIESALLEIEPKADVRWLRDIYVNSIAVFTFAEPAQKLRVFSEVNVDHYDDNPVDFLIEPSASSYPFQYASNEQLELVLYRLPSYPYDGPVLRNWLLELYSPGQLIGTFELLDRLNTHIYEAFRYTHRDEPGVQLPCQTLAWGTGSCRDYAVLMMEAAHQRRATRVKLPPYCLGASSNSEFICARPCSNWPPIILSMFMTRPIPLAMNLFSPAMLHVTAV